MRKAVWVCLSLLALIIVVGTPGWAVERELCGVRLGTTAMDLLDKPGYGEPNFIGPLGAITITSDQPETGAARAAAGGRSGPAGPTTRGGGMGGGGGARGGGMRGGGMRGGGGARGGGMRGGGGARGGGVRGGGGARGGGMRAGGGAGIGGGGAARTRAATPEGPGMYWYYRRPGGAVVVLTLTREGEVRAITLSGVAPTPEGITTRGIGLGNGYMEIIAQYGYPDQMVSSGTVLEMTYVDHGVRFTLDSMRVREIAIGAHIAAAVEAAPAEEEAAPPPAGMSVEELRGYL